MCSTSHFINQAANDKRQSKMVLNHDEPSNRNEGISVDMQKQPVAIWQDIVAEKIELRAAKLEAGRALVKRGASGNHQASISPLDDIASLTTKMAMGSVTAEAVVLSYIQRYAAPCPGSRSALAGCNWLT